LGNVLSSTRRVIHRDFCDWSRYIRHEFLDRKFGAGPQPDDLGPLGPLGPCGPVRTGRIGLGRLAAALLYTYSTIITRYATSENFSQPVLEPRAIANGARAVTGGAGARIAAMPPLPGYQLELPRGFGVGWVVEAVFLTGRERRWHGPGLVVETARNQNPGGAIVACPVRIGRVGRLVQRSGGGSRVSFPCARAL